LKPNRNPNYSEKETKMKSRNEIKSSNVKRQKKYSTRSPNFDCQNCHEKTKKSSKTKKPKVTKKQKKEKKKRNQNKMMKK